MRRILPIVALGAACGRPPAPVSEPIVDGALGRAKLARVGVHHSADATWTPVVRERRYRIRSGELAVEVEPARGGRIVEFSYRGQGVVLAREASPTAYGSCFWTSPQTDWQWPPPPELDQAAWRVEERGAVLFLKSRRIERLGLEASQTLRLVEPARALAIEYRLANVGQEPHKVAPWQNTRVGPGGLTFYPAGDPVSVASSLKLEPVDGVVWYRHRPGAIEESQKAFADGAEGWLAHVTRGLLFLKVFEDVPPSAHAPGEAEIEIYVHEDGSFVEVEQQGPYQALQPGQSSLWKVGWALRRMPPGMQARAGNPELLDQARRLAQQLRPQLLTQAQ